MTKRLHDVVKILSSSIPDCWMAWKRKELMSEAFEIVQEDADSRRLLSEWTDLHCSSRYSYRRVTKLLTLCLKTGLILDPAKEPLDALSLSLLRQLLLSRDRATINDCVIELETLNDDVRCHLLEQLEFHCKNNPDVTVSAVAIGKRLDSDSTKWMDFLLSFSLSTFTPKEELDLIDITSTGEWESKIGPALLLKARSHPDKALKTIDGWVDAAGDSILSEDWLQVLLHKQMLITTKDENQCHVKSILLKWASTNQESWLALSRAVAGSKPTVSPARFHCYTLLSELAAYSPSSEVDHTSLEGVLKFLIQFAGKDLKSDLRNLACAAFADWMALCRRKKEEKGYALGLDFIRKPILVAKPSQDAAYILAVMTERIHPDLLEGIARDLWKSDVKWTKGLEFIIENANSKRSAHTDGIVSVYWSLLYSATTSKPILPATKKLLDLGFLSKSSGAFLFAEDFLKSAYSNPLVRILTLRSISLYISIAAKEGPPKIGRSSLFTKALSVCVMSSAHYSTTVKCCVGSVTSSIQEIVDQAASSGPAILNAMYEEFAKLTLQRDKEATRVINAHNYGDEVTTSETLCVPIDYSAARRISNMLVALCSKHEDVAHGLIIGHAGTSLRSVGRQRASLRRFALNTFKGLEDGFDLGAFSDELIRVSCSDLRNSVRMHQAACSALVSLGLSTNVIDGDAKSSDTCKRLRDFVTNTLAAKLSSQFISILQEVSTLSEESLGIYQSLPGTMFVASKPTGPTESIKVNSNRLSEDEEWDLQVQRELDVKRGTDNQNHQDSALIRKHDEIRIRIELLVTGSLMRSIECIRRLLGSDIELGISTLQLFSDAVIFSVCGDYPARKHLISIQRKCSDLLDVLATCVFEVDEEHALSISKSLQRCCRPVLVEGSIAMRVVPFPSSFDPVATSMAEICSYGDILSLTSFSFVFPMFEALLTGPRTTTGCENVVEFVYNHAELLRFESTGSLVSIAELRKSMAIALLELLRYDRSQTFQQPSGFDALAECYSVSPLQKLSVTELSPLLDARGALGPKNCRLGSMRALGSLVAINTKMVKGNPLAENRVWLLCFDPDDDVNSEAKKVWAATNGLAEITPLAKPSPLFAAPLLSLLNHSNVATAEAAASAYAQAMNMLPNMVSKSVESLCKLYVDAAPLPIDDNSSAKSKQSISTLSSQPKKKTPLASTTGLPKRRATAKKSALDIARIGKPKSTKKKSVKTSALLKPKQERTLDDTDFANQFSKASEANKSKVEDSPSNIASRLGVLKTFQSITQLHEMVDMNENTLKLLTSFLVAYGLSEDESRVKSAARDTLRDIVASNGGSDAAVDFLLPLLENVLDTGSSNAEFLGSLDQKKIPKDTQASDRRKEGAVVALGSVALHLKGKENDSKIDNTINLLIKALRTPSEDVQVSVADALTKLMKKGTTQERIEALVTSFVNDCLSGDTLAIRRGGAYGLSAAVKGSGITSLKKYNVVKQLESACTDGNPNEKEGSLFAIELLSSRLGLLFEPHVISLLPSLLKSFSDSSDHVRLAASNTVGLIMSKLSAHGVKLVMPAVLKAFDDPSWRTKQASIHMLGAMSHLAPKQLASALPKVVPKLTEAFGDTHPKVKGSANEALNEISTVVRNPEIASISKTLLKALTEPAEFTVKALEVLIATEFLHAIDAPSLALICPVLHRGLRDRGATTKRYAGLIAGNISSMISETKDLIPYLPLLVPDLQSALLDPIPDVRSTSAKAMGSLTRSLGDHFETELRPWLLGQLRNPNCSSAERSGAAQGLTEVLIASGSSAVDDCIKNEILPLRSHPESSTREGVLWVLSFFPPALGQGFTPFIDISLPALIGGLSDESEPVRDVALRAGRVLIRSHGKVHVDKILPSLEDGLASEDHRIRKSSLSLLGDLLSMIGGTSVVKGDGDTQDDIRKAEKAQAQLALVLGVDTRRRVLSRLYMARCDSVHAVRQSALQVWKTVVSVTARTLRDILSVLVSKIVKDLASGQSESTAVAGRCLGDIVGKLGDSVLPQIIPVLRNALYEDDEHTKRGVCVGLTEVISCSTKDQILRFIEIIVKVVRDALCDESESVRKMAASAFQSLYTVVGSRAFDEVVPSLMVGLEHGEENSSSRVNALHGLTGILSVRSRELLPYIIPRLITRPIPLNHAKALSRIAQVTGSTIHLQLNSIIPAVLLDLADPDADDERKTALREFSQSLCGSIDSNGVNILISEIASKCGSDKSDIRRESCSILGYLVIERKEQADYYDQLPIIIREFVYRLNDDNQEVLKANLVAFGALSKNVPADQLAKHIDFMLGLISSMVSDARRRKGGVGDGEFLLPGFNIPRGIEPMIPILSRGLLFGDSAARETAATGLGDVIELTATRFLAGPLIVKMTGPLLRIVGDRNPSNVKIAILKTLGKVLVKGGPALRAFVPQFQTTFVKALADPSRQVRMEAIHALSLLMPLSTRVDPLIKDLVAGSLGKNNVADGVGAAVVQTATLQALAVVLEKGGSKSKAPENIQAALDATIELFGATDAGIREGAGKAMGAACGLLGKERAEALMNDTVLPEADSDASSDRHGAACAIHYIMASSVGPELQHIAPTLQTVASKFLDDDKGIVREAGCCAILASIGQSENPRDSFNNYRDLLGKLLANSRETLEFHKALAKGFCVALLMLDPSERLQTLGVSLLDGCLGLAMSGTQRVQYAFNDVLWLALNVEAGSEGIEEYSKLAEFENVRAMKSLHTKVLQRIKKLTCLDS